MKSADELYLDELESVTCSVCGKKKQRNHTFCKSCYYHLPPLMRLALYRRLNDGYEEAVDAAKEYLK